MPVTVAEIWRYPVKSMGGERLDNVAVDERRLVADGMVRDPELGSITTARRRPALLRCGARYAADPLGSAPEVIILRRRTMEPNQTARGSSSSEREAR